MDGWMEYLLRLSSIWAALLFFYYLCFLKNDNWLLKRRYLLCAYWLGLLIPLLPALQQRTGFRELASPFLVVNADIGTEMLTIPVELERASGWSSWDYFLMLYFLISTILIFRILSNYYQLWQWKKEGRKGMYGPYEVILHPKVKG